MRIQTPYSLSNFVYLGLDTSALRRRADDEFLAVGFGRVYVGIYPNRDGFQVAYGILNRNGSL